MRSLIIIAYLALISPTYAGRPAPLPSETLVLHVTFEVTSTYNAGSCRILRPARYAGAEFYISKEDPLFPELRRGDEWRASIRGSWRSRFTKRLEQKRRHDSMEQRGVPRVMISETLYISTLPPTDVIGPVTKITEEKAAEPGATDNPGDAQ